MFLTIAGFRAANAATSTPAPLPARMGGNVTSGPTIEAIPLPASLATAPLPPLQLTPSTSLPVYTPVTPAQLTQNNAAGATTPISRNVKIAAAVIVLLLIVVMIARRHR